MEGEEQGVGLLVMCDLLLGDGVGTEGNEGNEGSEGSGTGLDFFQRRVAEDAE